MTRLQAFVRAAVRKNRAHAPEPQILPLNIAGYVYITDVDSVHNTVTYLAPCDGALPGQFLIAGSLKVFFD